MIHFAAKLLNRKVARVADVIGQISILTGGARVRVLNRKVNVRGKGEIIGGTAAEDI